jgi:cytochrome P450
MDNIVAAISRRTAQDYAVGGYVIPAGSMVQLPLTDMAKQDPRWAGAAGDLDPNTFNPDRMLTKEGAKPGWSIPFGHGPRFCVGYTLAMAEVKVFLALFCRSYSFTADTNTTWSEAVGKVPANGLPMTITRLEQPLV